MRNIVNFQTIYTTLSKVEVSDAVEKAKAVANDYDATKEAVDEAAEKLLSAIEEFRNSLIGWISPNWTMPLPRLRA